MSFEHGIEFMPSISNDGGGTGEAVNTRQKMYRVDLGPQEDDIDGGLGPNSLEEALAFWEIDEPKYIDARPSTGIHCMDDNVTKPGIQLPGGILETRIVGRYMNRRARALPLRKLYKREAADILRTDPHCLWVHGKICAAGTFKRKALATTAENLSDACEFTGTVAEALKINISRKNMEEAGYTGGERAGEENERLWNLSFNTALTHAKDHPLIRTEEFEALHIVAGLAVITTPHRFNNALFREDHDVHGQKVGALAVTLGAYKKYLEGLARRGHFDHQRIPSDLMYATMFTFGLAKAKAHNNLRAAIVESID